MERAVASMPRKEADRATSAMAATRAGVLLVDGQDRIVNANAGAAAILRFEPDRLTGAHLDDVLPAIHLTAGNPAGSDADEQLAICGDSTFKMVSCYADPVDEHCRVIVFTDLTRAKTNERDLLLHNQVLENASHALFDAKLAAEEQSKRKSEFLARVSHEIRTPMTAILGFAEELVRPAVTDTERQEVAEIIRRNVEHLMAVLNDILDLAKVEADRMEVRHEPVDPIDLAREILDLFGPAARRNGAVLRLEPQGAIPERISSDPTRLRQILINLVSNAIKSGARTVRLGIRIVGHADVAQLELTVADDGPGMTPGQLAALFQPFSPGAGGAGLGLSISRRLAGLLGGDLTAESEAGRGSTFRLRVATGPLTMMPHAAFQPEEATGQPPESLDARILIADDGADNRRLISAILRRAGARIETAGDGVEAVAAALAATAAGRPFDLIVMDMQMPNRDGYAATRELRAAGWDGRILALTAGAISGTREQCLAAGCDAYAAKPIDRPQLLTAIRRLLQPAADRS